MGNLGLVDELAKSDHWNIIREIADDTDKTTDDIINLFLNAPILIKKQIVREGMIVCMMCSRPFNPAEPGVSMRTKGGVLGTCAACMSKQKTG
jgi:hypothetical protein